MSWEEHYVQASICFDCQEIIVLRQLGNIWHLPFMPPRQDKKEHKPTIIFATITDAKKVWKEANQLYWKLPQKEQRPYNKARMKSIELACDALGYVDKV